METQAVRYRILFWQQKLYGVDGFLYYLVNDWYEISENQGLNSKHEINPPSFTARPLPYPAGCRQRCAER